MIIFFINNLFFIKAHTEAVIMNAFVTKVDEILQSNPSVGKVLSLLCQIYGVTEILAHSGDYIQVYHIVSSKC